VVLEITEVVEVECVPRVSDVGADDEGEGMLRWSSR
jgi:hypothetical protein